MTLDEWLNLSGTGNAAFAAMMNARRHTLSQDRQANTPLATEDRVSRLRLGRRKVTPGEIVLVAELTGRAVQASDWFGGPPVPKVPPGGYKRKQYGVWIVHCGDQPMLSTAHISKDEAWQAAGFAAPVDEVKAKTLGYDCRMVSRFEPNRELRRVLHTLATKHDNKPTDAAGIE
jgi:hypothetical protein